MITNWLKKNKGLVAVLGLATLVVAWWLFRPEKLFVNERVNEAAPFTSTDQASPTFTGRFEARAQTVKGRATIYRSGDGKQELRLTDFEAGSTVDTHVLLTKAEDVAPRTEATSGTLPGTEVGVVKAGAMEQRFAIPAGTDLSRLSTVVAYDAKRNEILGVAKLEPF